MKLLMHICCAPCANMPIDALRADGIDLTGYWYNPNIHPFTEYRARRNCLQEYAKTIGLPLLVRDDYGLRPFVRAVAEDISGRCVKCYEMRLFEAARMAKEGGFDAFTSSLFISPYQQHELMRDVASPRRRGIRRAVLLSGLPPHVPRWPDPRTGAGLLYPEILRLRVLRTGAVSEAFADYSITSAAHCIGTACRASDSVFRMRRRRGGIRRAIPAAPRAISFLSRQKRYGRKGRWDEIALRAEKGILLLRTIHRKRIPHGTPFGRAV